MGNEWNDFDSDTLRRITHLGAVIQTPKATIVDDDKHLDAVGEFEMVTLCQICGHEIKRMTHCGVGKHDCDFDSKSEHGHCEKRCVCTYGGCMPERNES